MDYNILILTLSEILEGKNIYKTGLTLVYTLSQANHTRMNEDLFFRTNPADSNFTPSDEFEVVIEGITVKFIKEK